MTRDETIETLTRALVEADETGAREYRQAKGHADWRNEWDGWARYLVDNHGVSIKPPPSNAERWDALFHEIYRKYNGWPGTKNLAFELDSRGYGHHET